jgi:hypothetical protein
VLEIAEQHLYNDPKEVGGQNKGPWVRVYMQGNDGSPWAWCNGFVSFIIYQAYASSHIEPVMPYFFGVDQMVASAKQLGAFMERIEIDKIKPGDIFVNRHRSNANDWVHTGFITKVWDDAFTTIEGNTNDEGSREGYELCERTRGYLGKDFINLEAMCESKI